MQTEQIGLGRLRKRFGLALMTCALTLALAACDVSAMAFFKDHRVRIVEPEDRGEVTLPTTLRWKVDDFKVTGRNGRRGDEAGYFAVFVDQPPIPPGKTLEWYAQQEGSCGQSACGTVEHLAHIYATDDTELELDQLPAVKERGGVEKHEVVIVLLDGTGARIGESAFYVRFDFNRKGPA